jgi:GntR family histidine utilization transcriptional repressor
MTRADTQEPPPAGALSLARYAQVKDHVVRNIQRGDWPVGHRLPSENELVAQLGISRMTVNRALRELVAEKLIVRVQGVGTYVAENKPQSTLVQIGVISAEIRARGHAYRCQMLAMDRLAAPPDVGFWLELAPSEPVFHTVCLHFENGVPVQLEDRYVNARVVPAFLDQDFSVEPPGEYLTRNVPFDQIEHVVDAVLPTPDQARQLEMAETDPCLLLTRRTWMQQKVVTMVRCWHPASRYRMGSRFRPSGSVHAG